MNVNIIITGHLKKHGFQGLVNTDLECACLSDDLSPGDCLTLDCKPAYTVKADCRNCDVKCDGYDESPDAICFTTERPKEENNDSCEECRLSTE